jgi:hypothetical protein
VKQAVPGAKLDFKVNPQVSRMVDALGGPSFDDRYARSEWGWKHAFDLPEIIDSFVRGQERVDSGYLNSRSGRPGTKP